MDRAERAGGGVEGARYHVRVTETGPSQAHLRGALFGEGQGEMTGAGEAVTAVVVLVRLAPSCEAGATREEVGAGPCHSGFLFMAHSADLECTRGDNSKGEKAVGGSQSRVPHIGAGDLLLH